MSAGSKVLSTLSVPRWVEPAARPVLSAMRARRHAGTGFPCPCCGGEYGRFLTYGDPPRPDAACPRCGSLERHRLITLYLRQVAGPVGGRTLHVAPERAMMPVFRALATEYVTTDLFQAADVQADLADLPFPDDRWDFIVCSHVLEHVPDDAAAMRELRRVLAPGGTALVMVPRNAGPTDEDPSITSPAERLRRFGQSDHVRIYGDDLESRLESAGFDQLESITPDAFSADEVARFHLRAVNGLTGEASLLCRSR